MYGPCIMYKQTQKWYVNVHFFVRHWHNLSVHPCGQTKQQQNRSKKKPIFFLIPSWWFIFIQKKTLSFFCAWMIITPTLSIQRHLIWLKFSNKTNGFYCSLVVVVIFFILFILWFIKASKQTLWIFISELLDTDTHTHTVEISSFFFMTFKMDFHFLPSNII